MECPEESECSQDLDLEAIVGEEIHEWKESEIGGESESATGASREDRPDDSSSSPDSSFVMEILSMSEEESLIEDSYDKEWESDDHDS